MEKIKKMLTVIGTIVLFMILSPIIVFGLLCALIVWVIHAPGEWKSYRKSPYYRDTQKRFHFGITNSAYYRFYNATIERGLPIQYFCQEELEYFIYDDAIYMFPNFEEMDIGDESVEWEVLDDGDWVPFLKVFENHLFDLEEAGLVPSLPVKILVERNMVVAIDLRDVALPEQVQLIHSYETAFGEEQPLLRIPQNGQELYELMLATEDLCGSFEVSGDTISWNLYDKIHIEISVAPQDCMFSIEKKLTGITHWHPTCYEIYDEVCKVGKRGNVLVMRSFLGGASVLYMGPKADCPYDEKKKWSWGRRYYLEAK